MTRRAVSCRVIPVPGRPKLGHKIVFKGGWCSGANFSKSVNSFGPNVFCVCLSRSWLSIRGAKSQNEFETKPGLCTKGVGP